MDRSKSKKRLEAGRNALPTDHQTTVFLLKPGKHPLSLAPRDHWPFPPWAMPPRHPSQGKKRHRRRHTPNASSPVPRQSPVGPLASPRGCHRPASVVTSAAGHSSTPSAAHAGYHTTGTGNQEVQQGIQYLAQRRMRHPTPALLRCRRNDVLEQTPRSITHAFKSSCHTALLCLYRTV